MNNTNLPIYERLVDSYNSGDFDLFFNHISDDIVFKTFNNFKFKGSGTFITYFSQIGREMIKNNQHSMATLAELNNINFQNHKHYANPDCDKEETFPIGELAVLLRSDIFTRPHSIVFLEFNDKNEIKGMYITNAYEYSYTEINNSKALSCFELNKLAIDEAEKLFLSQGFYVERTEIQVQTLPHLRIIGAYEYNFNVFVFADNYPFSGQRNKKVEDYLVFSGMLNNIDTKFMYAQVKGLGKRSEVLLPKDRYSVEFTKIKDISQFHHGIGDINDD